MAIVKRLVKGSALTHAELDGNFTDLDTRVSTLESTTDSDSQTLTLVGTDLSISDGNTVDLSSLSSSGGIALTDISVTSLAAAGGGTLTYDNTTGVFDYTPPDLSSFSTFDGDYNSLTNQPTIPAVLTDLSIVDGTAGQVLTTDGAGSFTFTTVSGGGGSGLTDVVSDTTPQLGGDLDVNGKIITAASLNVAITPPAGGMLHLGFGTADNHSVRMYDMYAFPKAVPNTGDVLTAGAIPNELEWAAPAGGTAYTDSDVATYLGGNLDTHIVPDTNATYDIGTAEKKIRHLFLSDNSIKFVDATDTEFSLGVTAGQLMFEGEQISGGGGGGTLESRTTVTATTSSIADGATEDVDVTGFKGYMLMKIETDAAAWVRVYVSDAARAADAGRLEGTDPTADAGVIAEVITSGAQSILISPGAYGFNDESPVTTNIATRITNKSGTTGAVTATLHVLKLEA